MLWVVNREALFSPKSCIETPGIFLIYTPLSKVLCFVHKMDWTWMLSIVGKQEWGVSRRSPQAWFTHYFSRDCDDFYVAMYVLYQLLLLLEIYPSYVNSLQRDWPGYTSTYIRWTVEVQALLYLQTILCKPISQGPTKPHLCRPMQDWRCNLSTYSYTYMYDN